MTKRLPIAGKPPPPTQRSEVAIAPALLIAAARDEHLAHALANAARQVAPDLAIAIGCAAFDRFSPRLSVLIDQGLPRHAWSADVRARTFDVTLSEPRAEYARAIALWLART